MGGGGGTPEEGGGRGRKKKALDAIINVPKGEADVQAAMDEATLRESPKIERRTGYLAMLGNVATLLGLLGTIVVTPTD